MWLFLLIWTYSYVSIGSAPSEKLCFFHQEQKNPLERLERSIKAKVSTTCSGALTSMALLMEEKEGDILDAHSAIELILCRGAGLCDIDWTDDAVANEWKNKFICNHHLNELLREWDSSILEYKNLHVYRNAAGNRFCSMDTRVGPPEHATRPIMKRRYRLTILEANAILHMKGILVHPGTYMCKRHKQLAINIVTQYENQQTSEDSDSGSSQTSEDSNSGSTDEKSENADYEKSYQKEVFLRWTAALGETGVLRRDNQCYSTLGRSQKFETRALSRRLLRKQCEIISNDEGEALLKDTCSAYGGEATSDNKNYMGIMETLAEEFVKAETREERLLILSLIAPSFTNNEIRRFLPGISDYFCTEARRRAKRTETVEIDRKRVRYNPEAVNSFIEYITDSSQMVGMPYGTRKIRFSDKHREEIISVVRKYRNSQIITAYESYLKEIQREDLLISRSTLFKLLDICAASRQKAQGCVDYFYADATESMELVLDSIANWKQSDLVEDKEAQELKRRLEDGWMYYHTDFRIHLKDKSRVADHCMKHALTAPSDPSPCGSGDESHSHDLPCERCEQLKETITQLEDMAKKFTEEMKWVFLRDFLGFS